MKNYVKFLWDQMHGWTKQAYFLMFFGIGVQLGLFSAAPDMWNGLSLVGTVLSIMCVISISMAKSINGVWGLISAIIISIIAFHSTNYLTIAMQLSYIAFLDLPVLLNKDWNVDVESKIKHFKGLGDWTKWIAFDLVIFAVSALLIAHFTNDARPVIDAFSFSLGFTGSILCLNRYADQYYFWIAGGVLSIILWSMTAASGSVNIALAVNYAIFFLNDMLGVFGNTPWFRKKAV